MKFNKFKELREKAIEKLGLDESANLKEYKSQLNEVELEADNWGDFIFGVLRSTRNLTRLKAWYAVYNKKRLKLAVAKIQAKIQASVAADKQNEKLKEMEKKALETAKDETQKTAIQAKFKKQASLIKKQSELSAQKVTGKIGAQEKDNDAWMRRKEDKNEIVINYIARRWTYYKDLADADFEYNKGKAEIDAIKKFDPDSDPKPLEKKMKNAEAKSKKKEAKAKEAKTKADEEQKEVEDKNKEKMEQFKKDVDPKLQEFMKHEADFESAGDEVIMDKEKLEEIQKQLDDAEEEEEKEGLRDAKKAAEEAIKESKKTMVEARKAANKAKDSIPMGAVKKLGMEDKVNQMFDEWQKKQDEFKEELKDMDDAAAANKDKDKDKGKDEEVDTEAIKKEIDKAKEEADAAKEELDELRKSNEDSIEQDIKEVVALNKLNQKYIKEFQAQQKLAKAEKDDEKVKELSDKIKKRMEVLQDTSKKLEELKKKEKEEKDKGEKDKKDKDQKKKETEEKRKELEKKITSAETKIAELKDKDPDKAKKIQDNVDKLYDKLDKLDKDSSESEYMAKLLEIEGEIDQLLFELEGGKKETIKPKTMKFADFLEMKKNK